MTQSNTLELAKKGDAKAIAALMNRHLQQKGITVTVINSNDCLQIFLESKQLPDQQALAAWVHKSLTSLDSASIQVVVLYGQHTGEDFPVWNQKLELTGQQLTSPNSQLKEDTPPPVKSEQKSLSSKKQAQEGDIDAITNWLNLALQQKGITATTTLKDNYLQIILEAEVMPDENDSVRVVRREIKNLKLEKANKVKIYGRRKGDEFPAWIQDFDSEDSKEPIKPNLLKPAKFKHLKTPVLVTALVLIVSVPIGLFIWLRVSQEQAIAKAQKIIASIENANQTSNSDSLKAAQKNLKDALNTLEKVPNIPGISYQEAQTKITTTRPLLESFEQSIKAAESFESAQKIAGEAENLVSKPAYSVADLQQSKAKWQQAVNLLESIPEGTSVYAEAKEKLTDFRSKSEKAVQKLEIKESLEKLRPDLKAAVEQFSAVNSRLDVGMNYRDYGAQVRELKVALDRLAQQPGATKLPVYNSLNDAFKDYDFALDVWRYYIESDETNHFFPAASSYGSRLVEEYKVETKDIVGSKYIYLNDALSKVWFKASQSVKEAQDQI